MTTTMLQRPTQLVGLRSLRQLAVAIIIATALLVATFIAGRVTSPSDTVRTFVPIPTVHTADQGCRLGRIPC